MKNVVNKARLGRLVTRMQEQGMDEVLVTFNKSIYYLTGCYVAYPGERLIGLLINRHGDVRFLYNRVNGNDVVEGAEMVLLWDTDDAVGVLAGLIRGGTLGVEKVWPAHFLLELMVRRPDLKIVNGSAAIDSVRMVKDAGEIALLRQASIFNDAVFEAGFMQFSPDMTEREFAKLLKSISAGLCGEPGGDMVCYGEGAADPHHLSADVKVLPGQSILVDGGRPFCMYESDMTRTVFFGEPSPRDREVYEAVRAANLAAEAVIRPGVRCCDIDRAGRAVIEAAGYGKYFTHRLGHNLGLEGHEPPDIGPLCEMKVLPGMCFSVEPGIYLPGEMGVRVEDLVLVTEDGCEVLNFYTKGLQIL